MAYVKNINGYDIKDEEGRILISDLDDRVTDLHAPYYVLIGDSYGYDAIRDGNNITGWGQRIRLRYGLTEGTDCFSDFEAGAGVYNPADGSGRTFADMITYVASGMTSEQKRLVGNLVIAGGTNDLSAEALASDFFALFTVIRTNARAEFPNAKITVVPVGMSNASRTARLRAPELYAKWQAACFGLHISFAWGAWFYRYDKRLEVSDHVHLNNAGSRYCAAMISNAIEGSACGYYARETITVTPASGYTTASLQFEMILQDGMITFNKTETNHQFYLDSPGSFQMGSSQHNMGSFASLILPDNAYIVYRSTGRAHDSANSIFFDAPVLLWFTSNNFNITMPYTEGQSGYKTVSSCDFIGIDFNDFVASAFTM